MGKLTTHVLDVTAGRPAAGVRLTLSRGGEVLARAETGGDGRCPAPLLEGDALQAGEYELVFEIGAYFRSQGTESPFLDAVPVKFRMAAGSSYHVPLVASPWSYSVYRGS